MLDSIPIELQGDLQIALLLAESEELSRLHSDRAVQKWLDQFWAGKDPTPGTSENEALEIFRQRIKWIESRLPAIPVQEWEEPWKSFLVYGFPVSQGAELTNGSPPWQKTFYGYQEQPVPGIIRDRYDFNTPASFTLVFEDTVLVETRGRFPPSIPPLIQNVWSVLEDPTSPEGHKIRALLNLSWYELPSIIERILRIPRENFTLIEEYRDRALHSLAVRGSYLLGQGGIRRIAALRAAGGSYGMVLERILAGTYSQHDLTTDLSALLLTDSDTPNPVAQYLNPRLRFDSDALFTEIIHEYPSQRSLTGWDWRGDVTLAFGKPDWFNVAERTAITLWIEPEEFGVGDVSLGEVEQVQFKDTISRFIQFSAEKFEQRRREAVSATRELTQTLSRGEEGVLPQTNLMMLEQLHIIAPPETYDVEVPAGCRTLPITMDATVFASGPDSLDLQITFGIPARELSILTLNEKRFTELEVCLKLFNREREQVWMSLRQGGYQLEGGIDDPSTMVMDTFRFTFPVGSYVVYLSARDPRKGMNGGVLSSLEVVSGDTSGLKASPILLAGDIQEEEGSGKFHRGGYRVLPAPSRHFIFGYDIHLYFEIMNLQMSEYNDCIWNESYFFIPDAPGEGIIRISTEQDYTRIQPQVSRSLALNTDSGMAGTYEGPVFLVVLVSDKISGKQTVTATRFYIDRR